MGTHLRAEPMHNMGESQSFGKSKKMCLAFNQINFLVGHLLKGKTIQILVSVSTQFSSVAQSCPTLCNPMDCSTPGLPVHHQLPEFTQTHVHWVGDAIQPFQPLSSPSPAFNQTQHQGLFQWISSSHQVAKVLEFQLQHQFFQWTLRTDLLQDGLVGSPCSPRDSQESSPTQTPPKQCTHIVVQSPTHVLVFVTPVDCSTPGFSVPHHLLEFAQVHVLWIGDAIQPSHSLSSPPLPAFNLSQNQGLFKWVSSSHQVVKILEF